MDCDGNYNEKKKKIKGIEKEGDQGKETKSFSTAKIKTRKNSG